MGWYIIGTCACHGRASWDRPRLTPLLFSWLSSLLTNVLRLIKWSNRLVPNTTPKRQCRRTYVLKTTELSTALSNCDHGRYWWRKLCIPPYKVHDVAGFTWRGHGSTTGNGRKCGELDEKALYFLGIVF